MALYARQQIYYDSQASLVSQLVKDLPAMWETWVQSMGGEDLLEMGKSTPVFWPGEFHGLYSPWCHKVKRLSLSLQLPVVFLLTV